MMPFLPTRKFNVILDPELLNLFWTNSYMAAVVETIKDLKELDSPVHIDLFTPSNKKISASFDGLVGAQPIKKDTYAASKWIKADRPAEAEKIDRLDTNAAALLNTSEEVKADCIVTSDQNLIDMRYLLYHYDRIRIIPLEEFHDFVEVCARGFSIFWSATSYNRGLTQDVYYQFDHPGGKKMADYYNALSGQIKDDDLRENLRSLCLNRYTFILLSRDLLKFYEIQNDYFTRRELTARFGTTIGYYVTNYYLYGWGLLDQLTTILNATLSLQLDDKECGILKRDFWKKVKDPALKAFKTEYELWLTKMADIRHLAAHRTIMIPTSILAHTEESQVSDEVLREELRRERPIFYQMPHMEPFEKMELDLLRMKKMRTYIPRAVYIKKKVGKSYMYDPVLGADHELRTMNKFINMFLEKAFNASPSLS